MGTTILQILTTAEKKKKKHVRYGYEGKPLMGKPFEGFIKHLPTE